MKHEKGVRRMNTERQRVSIREAARVLGMSPNRVQNLMKRDFKEKTNVLPIGHALPSSTKKTCRYVVYKNLVMQFAGLTEWPEGGEEK